MKLRELERKRSELIEKLAGPNRPSETDEPALREALAKVEQEYRAELTSVEERAVKPREKSLLEGFSVAKALSAILKGVEPDGKEGEVAKEMGYNSREALPAAVFFPDWGNKNKLEMRADDTVSVTSTVGGNLQQDHKGINQRFFRRLYAMMIPGIDKPMVRTGSAEWSTITAVGAGGGVLAAGSVSEGATATISSTALKPTRLSKRFRFTKEAALTLPNLEQALRMDAASDLAVLLDGLIFSGTGVAPQWSGLNGQITFGSDPSAVVTVPSLVESIAGLLTHPYSYSLADLRIFLSSTAYAKIAGIFNGAGSDKTGLQQLMDHGVSVVPAEIVPADASNIASVIGVSTMPLNLLGYCPIWETIEVIRDNVTDAKTSTVNLTLNMFTNFALARAGGLGGTKLQLA